ncbi:MAG: hypothetical protein JSS83_15620 [Cyanobacteria bacterium SZAS LIN-3]|nr:hypothetical protein [Cyanobacteria bacterium SZAS LIN-3]
MLASAIKRLKTWHQRRTAQGRVLAYSSVFQSIAEASSTADVKMGLPSFDSDGQLPPGIYAIDRTALVTTFGGNARRRKLLQGLKAQLEILKQCGCKQVYLGGSFVSTKEKPGDFDGCFLLQDVDQNRLEALEPRLLGTNPDDSRRLERQYGGAFTAQDETCGRDSFGYLEFLQFDDRTGKHKGIVLLSL